VQITGPSKGRELDDEHFCGKVAPAYVVVDPAAIRTRDPPASKYETNPRGNAGLRLVHCEGMQGAALACTGLPGSLLAHQASDQEAINSAQQLPGQAIRFGVTSMQNMSLMTTSRYVRALQQANLPIRAFA